MTKKQNIYFSIIIISILLIGSVSAGFFDWVKDKTITGKATSQNVGLNISVGAGNSPEIVNIFNATFSGGVTLNLGPANTTITVNFTALDADGHANLDDTTAQINLTRLGETTRSNTSCENTQNAGNYANYSCKIMLYWYDDDGPWTIRASINDLSSNQAVNTSANLTVNLLTGFVAGPGNLTFATLSAGASNSTSNNDPLKLNNTGNDYIFRGKVEINATNLTGETDASKVIFAGNFSVGNSTDATLKPECDIPQGTAANMTVVSGNAYAAVNSTLVNATLEDGNYTINDGTAQKNLYVCLRTIGADLSQQAYSYLNNNQGPWTIRIVSGQ